MSLKASGGDRREVTVGHELLLVVVLGLVGAPAYAMMSILSSAMRRTADITGRGGSLRKD